MADQTVTQFRIDFPEFANTTTYPNSSVQFWLTVATKLVNPERWGDLLSLGESLFAAHNLVLEARAQKESSSGKIGGLSVGVLTSKSVDKVSAGYDAASAMEPGAGHWNLTVFGQRYISLARLHGAGPLHVGAPDAGTQYGAWAGPFAPWQ